MPSVLDLVIAGHAFPRGNRVFLGPLRGQLPSVKVFVPSAWDSFVALHLVRICSLIEYFVAPLRLVSNVGWGVVWCANGWFWFAHHFGHDVLGLSLRRLCFVQ